MTILARILRLAFVLAVAAGVLVLFAYAFLAALILIPVLGLLFFLFGRRYGNIWVVPFPPEGDPGFGRRDRRPPAERHPPVIDHDPNDLPPADSERDGR